MKVILQHNVSNLGSAGEVVEAASGYFRNYLAPRNLAIKASPGALKKCAQDLEVMQRKAKEAYEAKLDMANRIEALESIEVMAKAGSTGKLFGKVTTKEIAEKLTIALESPVDKKIIKVSEEMNYIGSYQAKIKLAMDIEAKIMVTVSNQD